MTNKIHVKLIKLPHCIRLPEYKTPGSVGMDLCAAIPTAKYIMPHKTEKIPTGIKLEIPEGYMGDIRPRSSAFRINLYTHGTVDSDYRGEVYLLVHNMSNWPVVIKRGQAIAQIVFSPVAKAELVEVEQLSETERGEGGFGSTGK